MSQFTVYTSADASAPVLDGNADATNLIALLDAVLVNGYGSKAAAGWGHPFTGSATKQVYRGGAGTRFYLRVLDDASAAGGRRDAFARGYESMSDVDTGTNAFPTTTQISTTGGLLWRKTATADTTARPWVIFADSRTCHLFIQSGDTGTANQYLFFSFGDIYSYNPSDVYNCLLIGSVAASSASAINFGSTLMDQHTAAMQTTQQGHYIARNANGTGASTNCYKKGATHLCSTAGSTPQQGLAGVLSYPNSADGGLYLHPVWIMDGTTPDIVHGELRGFYHQCHTVGNFGDRDTFSGVGAYSGKTFLIIKPTPNTSAPGVYVIETSNTLGTN